MENVYYPPAIREAAPSSFEGRDVPEEAEAAGPKAVVATIAPDEPARESELFWVAEISEGLSSKTPQKTV